jgi:hypothetical protein
MSGLIGIKAKGAQFLRDQSCSLLCCLSPSSFCFCPVLRYLSPLLCYFGLGEAPAAGAVIEAEPAPVGDKATVEFNTQEVAALPQGERAHHSVWRMETPAKEALGRSPESL